MLRDLRDKLRIRNNDPEQAKCEIEGLGLHAMDSSSRKDVILNPASSRVRDLTMAGNNDAVCGISVLPAAAYSSRVHNTLGLAVVWSLAPASPPLRMTCRP